MSLNTVDEAGAVLQAMKDGKKIEFYSKAHTCWFDLDYKRGEAGGFDILLPNFAVFKYRVKKESIVRWGVVTGLGRFYTTYASEAEAIDAQAELGGRVVRLVEEVDES